MAGSERGSGPGASGPRELTAEQREQEYLDLWAFATSPQGLNLSSAMFWASTSRELAALRKQWERTPRMYAELQATLHNAHFQTDGVPWRGDDFLGRSNREVRKTEKIESERAAIVANTNLMKIKRGAPPPPEVPAWAIGEYHA